MKSFKCPWSKSLSPRLTTAQASGCRKVLTGAKPDSFQTKEGQMKSSNEHITQPMTPSKSSGQWPRT